MTVIMGCMVTHIPYLCHGEAMNIGATTERGMHSNIRRPGGGFIFFETNPAWNPGFHGDSPAVALTHLCNGRF